jgi:predicted nucleic acid-binding protein
MDLKTTEIYGDVYMELRRKGKALSQVDIIVAAMARQRNLTVLTTVIFFATDLVFRTFDLVQCYR